LCRKPSAVGLRYGVGGKPDLQKTPDGDALNLDEFTSYFVMLQDCSNAAPKAAACA